MPNRYLLTKHGSLSCIRLSALPCRQCLWHNWTLRIISHKLCSWLLLPRWSILEHANFLSLRCGIQMSTRIHLSIDLSTWNQPALERIDLLQHLSKRKLQRSLLNHFWYRATIVTALNLLPMSVAPWDTIAPVVHSLVISTLALQEPITISWMPPLSLTVSASLEVSTVLMKESPNS